MHKCVFKTAHLSIAEFSEQQILNLRNEITLRNFKLAEKNLTFLESETMLGSRSLFKM